MKTLPEVADDVMLMLSTTNDFYIVENEPFDHYIETRNKHIPCKMMTLIVDGQKYRISINELL